MRVSSLAVVAFWAMLPPWPIVCMGQDQTAVPGEAIALPRDPAGLAQRLVELSRARFDLHYRNFGVQEVLEKLDLAQRLRMVAARLEGDEEAELAAAESFHRELKQICAAVEMRCQGTTAPIIDRELMRYRVQQAAALAARHAGDKTAEIECCRKAVAAAAELQLALRAAYETDVLPWTDMLQLSRHPCEARIALIDVTANEPAEAMKARAAVLGELLHLADEVLESRQILVEIGWASRDDLDALRVERFRIVADLARERGSRDEELRAVQDIADVQSRRCSRAAELYATGSIACSEHEKAISQVDDARLELSEVQAGHELEVADDERAQMELQGLRTRLIELETEIKQGSQRLSRLRLLHHHGACDALAVVEAAIRYRLAAISREQCQLNLVELHRQRDADMK